MARPSDQALVSDQAAARLDPSGFDPSRSHRWDDTDWHAFVQSIAHHWSHPEDVAVAYQAAAECAKILRAEMERRDRNETRNCINWGPCSRHDGRMCDSDRSGEASETRSGSTEGESAGPQDIAQPSPHPHPHKDRDQ